MIARRATGRGRVGAASPSLLWQAPLPDGRRRPSGVRAFVDRGGAGDLLPAPRPRRRRVLRRPLDVLGRRAKAEASRRELAGRSGSAGPHPERRAAAGRPAPGPAVLRAARASSRRWPRLQGRRPAPGPGHDRSAAAPTSARPRRAGGDSSLATDGVVLYVLVQRALAAGAAVLGSTRQLVAGEPPRRRSRPAGNAWPAATRRISTEYPFHRGVYSVGRPAAGRESRGRRGLGPGPGRPPRRRAVPGPRLRPGRRPGRQPGLADPGDLADVPDRHDGGPGGRGGPLPAQAGAAAREPAS